MTDPLSGSQSAPALSFADVAPGTVRQIDVSEPGTQVQSRVYQPDGNGPLAYWPDNADGSKGKPKMSAVYNGVDETGEPRSLWAPLPSDLASKLADAQKTYGRQIGAGSTVDRIFVKLLRKEQGKAGMKNVYAVKIEDTGKPKTSQPDALGSSDPWSSSPAASDSFGDEPPF
uniref:Uncharacterized protein n=1 Tax=uncultured organism TaxID=155900 RepID=A0A7L9QC38_9ZZZZ|nr:hypothetical protein [uncultured organism]